MTFNFKTNWRTTTALCIATTIALATTTAYAANHGGLSDWDKRPHHNHFFNHDNHDNDGHNNNGHNKVKTMMAISQLTLG